jgi:hypothetical protein
MPFPDALTPKNVQPPEIYTQEDVQHILQIAIAKKNDQGELTRSQLWEIAAELEIDRESLVAAEREWLNQREIDLKKVEFDSYRREQLRHSVVRYLIINGFVMGINLLAAHTLTWSLYLALILGLPLTLQTWKTLQTKGKAYELAFQRWNLKNEVKQSLSLLWNRLQRAWQGN